MPSAKQRNWIPTDSNTLTTYRLRRSRSSRFALTSPAMPDPTMATRICCCDSMADIDKRNGCSYDAVPGGDYLANMARKSCGKRHSRSSARINRRKQDIAAAKGNATDLAGIHARERDSGQLSTKRAAEPCPRGSSKDQSVRRVSDKC